MPFKTTYFDTRQQAISFFNSVARQHIAFFCFKHTDSQDRQNGHYFVANEQDYKALTYAESFNVTVGDKAFDISLEIVSE